MSDEVELPDEVDESERDAWEAWLANGNTDDSADDFRDAYAGEYLTVEEYVEQTINECYDVPEWVEYYIDWKSMAHDWQLNGDIWVADTTAGYFIFRGY